MKVARANDLTLVAAVRQAMLPLVFFPLRLALLIAIIVLARRS